LFALLLPEYNQNAELIEEIDCRFQIMFNKYLGELANYATLQGITRDAVYNFIHCFYICGGYYVNYRGEPLQEDDISVSVVFNPRTNQATINLMAENGCQEQVEFGS
jgi:hypothetical protein